MDREGVGNRRGLLPGERGCRTGRGCAHADPGAAVTLHHAEYIPRMPDGITALAVSSPWGDAGEGCFVQSVTGIVRRVTEV